MESTILVLFSMLLHGGAESRRYPGHLADMPQGAAGFLVLVLGGAGLSKQEGPSSLHLQQPLVHSIWCVLHCFLGDLQATLHDKSGFQWS